LQFLRAIAVAMVVVDHTNFLVGLEKYLARRPIPVECVHLGELGVNIFFVISGFIIAYTCLSDGAATPNISLATYSQRRFMRIVPFLWVCIAVYALFRYIGRDGAADWFSYLRAAIFYPFGPVVPNQTWTLRHEALFYAVFASVLFMRRGRWAVLVAWGTSPILYNICVSIGVVDRVPIFEYLLSRFNLLFLLGVGIGVLYRKKRWKIDTHDGVMIAILLGLSVASHIVYSWSGYSHLDLLTVSGAGVSATIMVVFAAGLTANVQTRIGRSLLVLGDASYAVYLTHGIFISGILGYVPKVSPGIPSSIAVFSIAMAATAGGVAVHVWVERPMVQWLTARPKYAVSITITK
jgi:peptidoglycan/LPS O-acetylase OafA/YrhL